MTATAIATEGLRKAFGDHVVLDGVDLQVPTATVFALLGANGSGKTTAINILTTLIRADGGSARVGGHDVATSAGAVRERISVTGQSAAVDHVLTARENLVLMAELRHLPDPGATATELLDRFGLHEAADRRLQTFSGGMRRRLDIAMSLVGEPEIIFFDEPTTGLDPESRAQMWQTIRDLVERGTTVFLTTQYLEEADHLADRIGILHDGRIVACGTPDELKARVPSGAIELGFDDEQRRGAARDVLGERHEVETAGSTLLVSTDGSVADLADVFVQLREAALEPDGFARKEPTLDDAFFRILAHEKEAPDASAR